MHYWPSLGKLDAIGGMRSQLVVERSRSVYQVYIKPQVRNSPHYPTIRFLLPKLKFWHKNEHQLLSCMFIVKRH